MTRRATITEEQARYAINHREMPEEVRNASGSVAVVLTQGWCPQWTKMKGYLRELEENGEPADRELTVFELVYDEVPYFDEFRDFKEAIWQNYQIPYVRYYSEGELVDESNYVPRAAFLSRLSPQESDS